MKNKYGKGASAERELLHKLAGQGFAVVRAAGSGTIPLPCPDIVALKNQNILAFECKAWNSAYLNLAHQQMDELKEWAGLAKAALFIGWKIPNKGWLFIEPKHFKKNAKNYSISRKKASKKALALSVILGKQARLKV